MPSYVDYTKTQLNKFRSTDNVLVICPGFTGLDQSNRSNRNSSYYIDQPGIVTISGEDGDLIDSLDKVRKVKQFNRVIMNRVFEHLPIRNIDYYICQLYSVMAPNGIIEMITPDSNAIAMELQHAWKTKPIDLFRIHRLNHELFSEGNDVKDRHCLWCDEHSVKYLMEAEGLFKFVSSGRIRLDSNIIPPEIQFEFKRI